MSSSSLGNQKSVCSTFDWIWTFMQKVKQGYFSGIIIKEALIPVSSVLSENQNSLILHFLSCKSVIFFLLPRHFFCIAFPASVPRSFFYTSFLQWLTKLGSVFHKKPQLSWVWRPGFRKPLGQDLKNKFRKKCLDESNLSMLGTWLYQLCLSILITFHTACDCTHKMKDELAVESR